MTATETTTVQNDTTQTTVEAPKALTMRGSFRTQGNNPTEAVRKVPAVNREREYPCQFKWEITDQKLLSRYEERLAANDLTPRQKAWYEARLGFRALLDQ